MPGAPDVFPEDDVDVVEELWDERRVKQLLEVQGQVTHFALRAGPEDDETWLHTQADLNAIAPPLTNILNRYDATRAAAAAGDEIALIAAVGTYATRNYMKRRRYLAVQAAQGPRPVTGVPAPEGVMPEEPAPDPGIELRDPPNLTPRRR